MPLSFRPPCFAAASPRAFMPPQNPERRHPKSRRFRTPPRRPPQVLSVDAAAPPVAVETLAVEAEAPAVVALSASAEVAVEAHAVEKEPPAAPAAPAAPDVAAAPDAAAAPAAAEVSPASIAVDEPETEARLPSVSDMVKGLESAIEESDATAGVGSPAGLDVGLGMHGEHTCTS